MQDQNGSGAVIRVGPTYSAMFGDISPIAYASQDQVPDFSAPVVPVMPDGIPFGQPTLPDPGTGSIRSVGAPMVKSFPDVANYAQVIRTAPLPTFGNSVQIGGIA